VRQRSHPGIGAFFVDEADLLRAIQTRWFHVLTGCLDVAIETGSGDLVQDLRSEATQPMAAPLRRLSPNTLVHRWRSAHADPAANGQLPATSSGL